MRSQHNIKTPELKFIRRMTVTFVICLALSGITAFPLVSETEWMMRHLLAFPSLFQNWIAEVYNAVHQTPGIVLYGTDWLAFAHIIIGLFFIGVYRDPVRNKFNVLVGMMACVAVFPLAFICWPLRGIPFFHQLIDCGFGIIGLVPLTLVYWAIQRLESKHPYSSLTPAL